MIFFLNSCNSRHEMPTNKEISEIILETIKQNKFDIKIPVYSNVENYYIKYKDNLPSYFEFNLVKKEDYFGFELSDSSFVLKQMLKTKNIRFGNKMIPNSYIIQNEISGRNTDLGMYIFFLPLFNKDKDFAMVEYSYMSANEGYGIVVYFRKVWGGWQKIKAIRVWVT